MVKEESPLYPRGVVLIGQNPQRSKSVQFIGKLLYQSNPNMFLGQNEFIFVAISEIQSVFYLVGHNEEIHFYLIRVGSVNEHILVVWHQFFTSSFCRQREQHMNLILYMWGLLFSDLGQQHCYWGSYHLYLLTGTVPGHIQTHTHTKTLTHSTPLHPLLRPVWRLDHCKSGSKA